MKKIVLSMVALLLAAGMVFAGGAQEETSVPHPRAGETNMYGWTIPEDRIVIDWYAGQDNPDTSDKWAVMLRDHIIDEFNVELNRTVYDTDQDERLNLMLASNDYPAIISGLSDAQYSTFIEQGRAQDISALVDQYGPNIKKELGDLYQRYFTEDGKLYGLPNWFGLLANPGFTANVRWDEYEAMGKPELETMDDYYEYLKKLVAQKSTSADNKVYALSFNDHITPEILSGFWGMKKGWDTDASKRTTTYWINSEEGLEMALWFNKVQRDGMLDPNAFINKYEDWKTMFSSERVVGHLGTWWHTWNAGHEAWSKQWDNWQPNQRHVQIPLRAASVDQAYLGPKDVMGSMTIITDKAENVEEIIKWFNFEITPMGTKLIGFGVPNMKDEPLDLEWTPLETFTSLWHINEDGSWDYDSMQKQAYLDGSFNFQYMEVAGSSVLTMVTPSRFTNEERPVNSWFGYCFNNEDKWTGMSWENMADTAYDFTAFEKIPYPSTGDEIVIRQQIEDIGQTGFANAVMAETAEECRAFFMEMREKANMAGLKQWEKYVAEEYSKNVTAWGIDF